MIILEITLHIYSCGRGDLNEFHFSSTVVKKEHSCVWTNWFKDSGKWYLLVILVRHAIIQTCIMEATDGFIPSILNIYNDTCQIISAK